LAEVLPAYTAYTWAKTMPGRPVPVLPITEVARTRSSCPSPRVPPDLSRRPHQRTGRVGTTSASGYLLQGDTRGASAAFELVAAQRKDLPDGPRNLARTVLEDGDPQAAIEYLQEAERRAPQDPRTAYWFGVARERTGQLEDATKALEAAKLRFPKDRTIHQRLGQIRYRLGDFEGALKDFLEVLRDRSGRSHGALRPHAATARSVAKTRPRRPKRPI
jgi:tetratricopeptide (TPR) repeat protein